MIATIGRFLGAVALVAAFGMSAPFAQAQDDDLPAAPHPDVPSTAQNIQNFVPSGWRLERSVHGDLNGDKLPDVALVIRSTDKGLIVTNKRGLGQDKFDSNPRTLIVAIAQKGGGFRRVGMSHDIIPRIDNPVIDDPFEDSPQTIAKGVLNLSIRFWASAGSWSMSSTNFTFRYQNGEIYLIGYDQDDIHRSSGEEIKISANFLTGRMSRGVGSIENDRVKTTWKNIGRRPLIKLEDVGNGWDFSPAPKPN